MYMEVEACMLVILHHYICVQQEQMQWRSIDARHGLKHGGI